MKIEIKGQNFPNLQETVQQCKGAFAALDLGIRNSPKEIAPKASQYIEPSIAQPHTHAGSILEGNASLPDVMAEIYKRIGTTGVIWRGENESVLSDTELQERRLQAMLNLWCKNLLNELSDCKDIDKAAEAVICGLDNGYRKAVALNEEEIAARFVRLFGLVSECVPKLRWPKKSNGESYEIVEALEHMKPNDTNTAATGKVSASTSATGDTEQPQQEYSDGLLDLFNGHKANIDELVGKDISYIVSKIKKWAGTEAATIGGKKTYICKNPCDRGKKSAYARELLANGIANSDISVNRLRQLF